MPTVYSKPILDSDLLEPPTPVPSPDLADVDELIQILWSKHQITVLQSSEDNPSNQLIDQIAMTNGEVAHEIAQACQRVNSTTVRLFQCRQPCNQGLARWLFSP